MNEEPNKTIRYFEWECDACRVIEYANGRVTADLYRGGKGLIEVNSCDVIWGGKEIGEKSYKELVLEEIAMNRNSGDS